MENIVLRSNATPVYAFLSWIEERSTRGEAPLGKKILDCGAGGPVPPLVLFHQHGYETCGIDISDAELADAQEFCDRNQINLNIRKGDMRTLPFEDGTFDYIYEHYSMCHLSKVDTVKAINEMHRVLKAGGLAFLGVISTDTWPKSIFGVERDVPGEYWNTRPDGDDNFHAMFSDQEADQLVGSWEIISKEKRCTYLPTSAQKTSLSEWMEIDDEVRARFSEDSWKEQYSLRAHMFQYAHLYYFLKKPGI
jgi:ubiquinone/menaquinone biosynthesis C-methylase UbiE